MSFKPISAEELHAIATQVAKIKEDALVNTFYNEIIRAAHKGEFVASFILESDELGIVAPEAWAAVEKVEHLFPGIYTTFDSKTMSYTFEWFKEATDELVNNAFVRDQSALEAVIVAATTKEIIENI